MEHSVHLVSADGSLKNLDIYDYRLIDDVDLSSA